MMGFRDSHSSILHVHILQRATEAGDWIVSHSIKIYASAVPEKCSL